MKDGSKNQPQITHGPTIDQQSQNTEVWRAAGQVWGHLEPPLAIQRVFGSILDRLAGVLNASWRGLEGLSGGHGPRKVANVAPTLPLKRSKIQVKLEPSTDQCFSASWDRFFEICLVDFELLVSIRH